MSYSSGFFSIVYAFFELSLTEAKPFIMQLLWYIDQVAPMKLLISLTKVQRTWTLNQFSDLYHITLLLDLINKNAKGSL
jgi:hypothetical protein